MSEISSKFYNTGNLKRSFIDLEVDLKKNKKDQLLNQECLFLTEIITKIFYCISNKDLAHASMVCRNWRIVINEDQTLRLKKANLDCCLFGKTKWKKYFGNIGFEPKLPKNIEEMLNRPCVFWPGKKIKDTHYLTLIPEKINGVQVNLNIILDKVKSKKNECSLNYVGYSNEVRKALGALSTLNSYWVLMTRKTIPGSESKTYPDQQSLIEEFVEKTGAPPICYDFPSVLEAVTTISMYYFDKKERIYTEDPLMYTTCKETVGFGGKWHPSVGGFGINGFHVYINYRFSYNDQAHGVGCILRFQPE